MWANEQCLYKVRHNGSPMCGVIELSVLLIVHATMHDCVFLYRTIYSCTTCCIFNHVKSMNKICRQVFKRTQLTAPNINEYHYTTKFSEKPSKQVTPTHPHTHPHPHTHTHSLQINSIHRWLQLGSGPGCSI